MNERDLVALSPSDRGCLIYNTAKTSDDKPVSHASQLERSLSMGEQFEHVAPTSAADVGSARNSHHSVPPVFRN